MLGDSLRLGLRLRLGSGCSAMHVCGLVLSTGEVLFLVGFWCFLDQMG